MRVILDIPISINEICEAINASVCKAFDKSILITAITTDTRECEKGDLFIALDGALDSGEKHVSSALDKISYPVSKSRSEDVIFVKDTSDALLNIAKLYKSKLKALKYTVAVTGSVGKSTTVKYITEILGTKYKVHAPIKNYNNHIGVPITVLSAPMDTEVLVLELGMNHRGEISRLSNCVNPDISVITKIGTSHIGNLGSRSEIAKAKLEILDGMMGGVILLPYGDPLLSDMDIGMYVARNSSLSDFSLNDQSEDSYSMKSAIENIEGIVFHDEREHLIYNLAFAISVAQMLGLNQEEIIKGTKAITNSKLRQRLIRLKTFTIFDDSYNASIESISADLKYMRSFGTPVSAFLGDVLELGEKSEMIHRQIGIIAAQSGLERLYLIGSFSKYTKDGAILGGMRAEQIFINENVNRPEISVEQIKANHISGETILFKASHLLRLDKIADMLEMEERMDNER